MEEKAVKPSKEADIAVQPKSESSQEADIVDFVDDDPLDPLNWSNKYKWLIVVLTALLSTIV